ncbi:uncharacterized protein BO96DRAFT_486259 [Aspergillus niger CBS 101883]|uniref:Uncharacterized protein n=3 Tax=Aspergillus niger TaxID=5061 RepID=A2RBK7_ASPNC|nr:uncharacterized protein BO96DRAFT_486259 [Aspergillus niger CBS 101883]XP_059605066.1 hypothetical protein An19g00220 [Aspergillus niger]PYH59747.1 hypothetical protein BO96DRAFT_486259 [Aspergillus niger CBS 101883]RDH24472.1 hypothetical protein M747DRAFT_273911 [Aspergillus niger ATCC 13496]CAK47345.1 hypothetical protein An19g00220 [Aspergillus niger]
METCRCWDCGGGPAVDGLLLTGSIVFRCSHGVATGGVMARGIFVAGTDGITTFLGSAELSMLLHLSNWMTCHLFPLVARLLVWEFGQRDLAKRFQVGGFHLNLPLVMVPISPLRTIMQDSWPVLIGGPDKCRGSILPQRDHLPAFVRSVPILPPSIQSGTNTNEQHTARDGRVVQRLVQATSAGDIADLRGRNRRWVVVRNSVAFRMGICPPNVVDEGHSKQRRGNTSCPLAILESDSVTPGIIQRAIETYPSLPVRVGQGQLGWEVNFAWIARLLPRHAGAACRGSDAR